MKKPSPEGRMEQWIITVGATSDGKPIKTTVNKVVFRYPAGSALGGRFHGATNYKWRSFNKPLVTERLTLAPVETKQAKKKASNKARYQRLTSNGRPLSQKRRDYLTRNK